MLRSPQWGFCKGVGGGGHEGPYLGAAEGQLQDAQGQPDWQQDEEHRTRAGSGHTGCRNEMPMLQFCPAHSQPRSCTHWDLSAVCARMFVGFSAGRGRAVGKFPFGTGASLSLPFPPLSAHQRLWGLSCHRASRCRGQAVAVTALTAVPVVPGSPHEKPWLRGSPAHGSAGCS